MPEGKPTHSHLRCLCADPETSSCQAVIICPDQEISIRAMIAYQYVLPTVNTCLVYDHFATNNAHARLGY